jgi:hypothetical protein
MFNAPTHQLETSVRNFLRRLPATIFQASSCDVTPPPVPLVLRVAVCGDLYVSDSPGTSDVVAQILRALKAYAELVEPRFRAKVVPFHTSTLETKLRAVSQLAAGFEQLVAKQSVILGYELHTVLAGSRADAVDDVVNAGAKAARTRTGRPPNEAIIQGLREDLLELLEKSTRVLELDRNKGSASTGFTPDEYEQAGNIILSNVDIMLLGIKDDDYGNVNVGTQWMERKAEEEGIPMVRVPLENPRTAKLIWTTDQIRHEYYLFDPNLFEVSPRLFAAPLDAGLLGVPFRSQSFFLRRWEGRYMSLLDVETNAAWWDQRWKIDGAPASTGDYLANVPSQIDQTYKPAKVWADRASSALAEISRGSFVMASLLGVGAVFGSVLTHLKGIHPAIGVILELGCLLVILFLIHRSREAGWRSRWLALREMERALEQAAWLALLGRTEVYSIPAHMLQLISDDFSKWAGIYLKAVLRNCAFPSIHLTKDYLQTVEDLFINNFLDDQINYYEAEIPFQSRSSEMLGMAIYILVWTSAALTCLVFGLAGAINILHFPSNMAPVGLSGSSPLDILSFANSVIIPYAALIGALLPATANALSSIRSQGEYAQLAARYAGSADGMRRIRDRILWKSKLRGQDPERYLPRSEQLAGLFRRATDIMMQETLGWHAILQRKEIEPT